MRMSTTEKALKFSCYVTAMFTVLVVLVTIFKPAKPVITEREAVRIELKQAINQAGLSGLVEIEE
jgi:biopolymer transport protein ExbD